MNEGKKFEQQFKKCAESAKGAWVYRFRDGTGSWGGGDKTRFQASNICDFEVFYKRTLFLIELKHHQGASIPYSAIRQNQISGLAKAAETDWIMSGFLIFFRNKERVFFVDALSVENHFFNSGRKSIPFSWCQENGIEVETLKVRTSYKFNIEKLLNELLEVLERNGGNLHEPYRLQCRGLS